MNTFVVPISAIGITLFYYDQRIRKEGYDIEWMMQAAGLTAPQPAPPTEAPLARPQPSPGWRSMRNSSRPLAYPKLLNRTRGA